MPKIEQISETQGGEPSQQGSENLPQLYPVMPKDLKVRGYGLGGYRSNDGFIEAYLTGLIVRSHVAGLTVDNFASSEIGQFLNSHKISSDDIQGKVIAGDSSVLHDIAAKLISTQVESLKKSKSVEFFPTPRGQPNESEYRDYNPDIIQLTTVTTEFSYFLGVNEFSSPKTKAYRYVADWRKFPAALLGESGFSKHEWHASRAAQFRTKPSRIPPSAPKSPPPQKAPPPPPLSNRGPAPVLRKPVQTAGLGNCYYDSLAVALLAQLPKGETDPKRILALQQFAAIHKFLKTSSVLDLKELAENASTADNFLAEILKTSEWRTNLTTALRLYLADLMSKKLNSPDLQSDDSTLVEFYAQLKSDFEAFKNNKVVYQDQANASHYSFSQVSAIQDFFEANKAKESSAIVAAFKAAQNQAQMLKAYIERILQDRAWADPIVQDLARVQLGDENYAVNPAQPSKACVQLKHDQEARHFSPLLSAEELAKLNEKITELSAKLSFIPEKAALVTTGSFKSAADFLKTRDWKQTYTQREITKTAAKEAPKKAELNNKTILITYVEAQNQQPAQTVSLTVEQASATEAVTLKAEHSKDEKTSLDKQYDRLADNLFLTATQLTKAENGRYRFDIDSVNHENQLQMIAASLYAAGFAEVFHKGEKLANKAAVADVEVQTEEASKSAPEPEPKAPEPKAPEPEPEPEPEPGSGSGSESPPVIALSAALGQEENEAQEQELQKLEIATQTMGSLIAISRELGLIQKEIFSLEQKAPEKFVKSDGLSEATEYRLFQQEYDSLAERLHKVSEQLSAIRKLENESTASELQKAEEIKDDLSRRLGLLGLVKQLKEVEALGEQVETLDKQLEALNLQRDLLNRKPAPAAEPKPEEPDQADQAQKAVQRICLARRMKKLTGTLDQAESLGNDIKKIKELLESATRQAANIRQRAGEDQPRILQLADERSLAQQESRISELQQTLVKSQVAKNQFKYGMAFIGLCNLAWYLYPQKSPSTLGQSPLRMRATRNFPKWMQQPQYLLGDAPAVVEISDSNATAVTTAESPKARSLAQNLTWLLCTAAQCVSSPQSTNTSNFLLTYESSGALSAADFSVSSDLAAPANTSYSLPPWVSDDFDLSRFNFTDTPGVIRVNELVEHAVSEEAMLRLWSRPDQVITDPVSASGIFSEQAPITVSEEAQIQQLRK